MRVFVHQFSIEVLFFQSSLCVLQLQWPFFSSQKGHLRFCVLCYMPVYIAIGDAYAGAAIGWLVIVCGKQQSSNHRSSNWIVFWSWKRWHTGSQTYVLWPALLKEELVHICRRDLLLVENWMLIKKYMTCSQEVLDSHGFQTSCFLKCMSFSIVSPRKHTFDILLYWAIASLFTSNNQLDGFDKSSNLFSPSKQTPLSSIYHKRFDTLKD